ncbi:MAG: hypothetical protein DSZ05_08040 [Sulfurospirillum sp.]|nr:MAG: hypothetical protein DSZ05_08040 [Sulfurospirillum sp.]
MSHSPGIFTISLDFELYWGMRDVVSQKAYRNNLEGTPEAVERMLSLFEKYGIHATWATVGFLFFENGEDLKAHLPAKLPHYRHKQFDLYDYLLHKERLHEAYHFAPQLIHKITQTAHQELATHTFSHYYCLEEGQDASAFEADIAQALRIAKERNGAKVTTLVFPRNQKNDTYIPLLKKHGITAYRGNEKHWIYDESNWEERQLLRRGLKLADTYLNISGHHTIPLHELDVTHGVADIPASRFLRPYSSRLSILEQLKLRRIQKSMTHAARRGEIYHLWWHPHNFGADTDRNIAFLEKIVKHFSRLHEHYGMKSLHMGEIATLRSSLR